MTTTADKGFLALSMGDGFGGGKTAFGATTAQYKRIPIFPLVSPAVDHFHSNLPRLRSACSSCFPLPAQPSHDSFVDLLQFSSFGGLPWPFAPGVRPPSRWFADLRYTWSTPLPYKYPSVHDEVINSERVAAVVARERDANPEVSERCLRKKVGKFFTEMKVSLSRVVCKVCAYVLAKVFRRLMTRLLVSPQQMKRLQEVNDTGIPLVYLPLHRSHLDYLLITWAAWHFGLPLPHIASGDNLNLSGFGWLLRATGAFFIRRRVDPSDDAGKDALYRAVLHSYIEQLLSKGMTIEFFLEGTRSRFGKSLLPKHGLISNVVEAVQQGTIKDCYLVPVSYTYDQVAEGVFLNELMGIPKVRESVMGVLRGVLKGFGVSKRCGAVRMHYGQPVLLTDYLTSLSDSLSSSSRPTPSLTRLPHSHSYRELVPWHHEHEERVSNRRLIRAIGYHIVYEAQSIVSVSLVSVVSSLLLCKFRQGVDINLLSADVQWLCESILSEGSDIVGWRDRETSGRSAVDYALPFLRDSVDRLDDVIEPMRSHRQLIHLAYSKNSLVPLFAIKSALALSIVSRPSSSPLSWNDVIDDAMDICDWMQDEVIFCRPCENIRSLLSSHLSDLCQTPSGILIRQEKELEEEELGDASTVTIQLRDPESRLILLFFSNLLRPFLQSLYVVASRLAKSIGQDEKESSFIRSLCKDSLENANGMQFDVLLESINSDSFKNSIRMLRERGAIQGAGSILEVPQVDALRHLADRVLQKLRIYY